MPITADEFEKIPDMGVGKVERLVLKLLTETSMAFTVEEIQKELKLPNSNAIIGILMKLVKARKIEKKLDYYKIKKVNKNE